MPVDHDQSEKLMRAETIFMQSTVRDTQKVQTFFLDGQRT